MANKKSFRRKLSKRRRTGRKRKNVSRRRVNKNRKYMFWNGGDIKLCTGKDGSTQIINTSKGQTCDNFYKEIEEQAKKNAEKDAEEAPEREWKKIQKNNDDINTQYDKNAEQKKADIVKQDKINQYYIDLNNRVKLNNTEGSVLNRDR